VSDRTFRLTVRAALPAVLAGALVAGVLMATLPGHVRSDIAVGVTVAGLVLAAARANDPDYVREYDRRARERLAKDSAKVLAKYEEPRRKD
jgi:hypothetical protein